LIFGDTLSLGKELLREPISKRKSDVQLSTYLSSMIRRQRELIKIAQETQQNFDTHHISSFDPEYDEYPIESYVLLRHPKGKSAKLRLRNEGPFQVISREGDNYTLQNLITNATYTYHISNLRPFNLDRTRDDPRDVALKERDEFVIEKILEHKGDHRRRNTMQFLVSWKDYPEEDNSWEPYHELRDTEKLIEYLASNKLKSLIGKKHTKVLEEK